MRSATTHIDRTKQKLTKQAIENAVERFNQSNEYLPLLIEHDLIFGVQGYIFKAEVEELDDGEFAMVNVAESFEEMTEGDKQAKLAKTKKLFEIHEKDEYRIVINRGTKYKYKEHLTLLEIPGINDLFDRYGLIEINNDITVSNSGFLVKGRTLPFHHLFRRSHTIMNSYNQDLIDRIIRILRTNTQIKISLRPEIDLMYLDDPENIYFEKDYWYGPKFPKSLENLQDGVTVHGMAESSNTYSIKFTDFWFYSQSENIKVLQIEEVRENGITSIYPHNTKYHHTRYLHAEIDIELGLIRHFDIAIRLYNTDNYNKRLHCNIRQARTQLSTVDRIKAGKFDGEITLTEMLSIAYSFFRGNPLLLEYFGEEAD